MAAFSMTLRFPSLLSKSWIWKTDSIEKTLSRKSRSPSPLSSPPYRPRTSRGNQRIREGKKKIIKIQINCNPMKGTLAL